MAASEIEKLERLVRENPKGRQFAILADAYRKDGQFQRALDVLAPGLEVHPDYVSARVVLGRVLMAMGDNEKAKEAFTRVVTLDPESVIALKALADLAEEQGDGPEALQRASQLLTVDPGNEEAQKQVERLSTQVPAQPEVRLSGIVPMMDDVPPEAPPAPPVAAAAERTLAPFEPVKPPVVKTVEIPAVTTPSSRPSFAAIPEPLDQAPEPLPLMPLSEEAQVEQTAEGVRPLAALEPTSFETAEASTTPTERLAGLDPAGMSPDEVASIGAAAGFEPTSGPLDTTDLPRTSLTGLESISGEVEPPPASTGDDIGLEREQEIELGGTATNEFQEASAAETLRRRSGANEFQVGSDSDTLDAAAAQAPEAIETGGSDLAFIDPEPEPTPTLAFVAPVAPAPQAPVFTPAPLPPEEPEPAVAEPEPVVTEAMAELYASQGHLAEALEVYRQLAEREPGEPRFAERLVELEMFGGGSAPAAPPVPAVPAAPMMAPVAATAPRDQWDSQATGGKPVGSWLSEVFAEALPREAAAPTMAPAEAMAAPELMVEEEAEEEISAPLPLIMPPPEEPAVPPSAVPSAQGTQGQPTRPASAGFSLNNVFGDERPGAPVAKAGSFDDFFGASTPAPASPPPAPAPGPGSIRTTRPANPVPPGEDDLSSFQDWLKGLKK